MGTTLPTTLGGTPIVVTPSTSSFMQRQYWNVINIVMYYIKQLKVKIYQKVKYIFWITLKSKYEKLYAEHSRDLKENLFSPYVPYFHLQIVFPIQRTTITMFQLPTSSLIIIEFDRHSKAKNYV